MRRPFSTLSDVIKAIAKASFTASFVGAIAMIVGGGVRLVADQFSLGTILQTILQLPPNVLMVSVIGLLFTVPTTVAVVACVYPLALRFKGANNILFAISGFAIGCGEWLAMFYEGSSASGLGSWSAAIFIGGLAGCAGGIALAQHLRRHTLTILTD